MDVVGRGSELLALQQLLADRTMLPRAVVLTGEPGAGKSTLLEAAAGHGRSGGYLVLRCRPAEAERGFAFAGLRDLLEEESGAAAHRLPPAQRGALETALLGAQSPAEDATAGAVAVATHSLLRELAEVQPLLLVLDDVQWLDVSTEAVLSFVCRRLAGHAVALVIAVRERPRAQLVQTIRRSFPEERVQVLPVGPLSVGATGALLRQRFASLPRPLLRRVHAAAGGNPFIAIEIARSLDALGRPLQPGQSLPFSSELTDLLQARLDRLPDRLRRHLPAIAASSRPRITMLAALQPSGRVDRDVQLGVREEILAVEDYRVRFTHPVLAEHCYGSLTDDQRRSLHRRLAHVSVDPEERARHLGLSAQGADAVIADELAAAARRAFSRGAVASAAELSEQARELTPGDRPDVGDRRSIECARYHFMSGDASRAGAILNRLSRRTELPGPLRAEALTVHARVCLFTDDLPLAVSLFERAASDPQASDDIRGEAEEGLAWSLVLSRRRIAAAARRARAAVDLARVAGGGAAIAETLATRAVCEALLGRRGAMELAEQAVVRGRPYHFSRAIRRPEWVHALILVWHDRLNDARATLETLLDYAVQRGDESSLARIEFALGCVLLQSGSWQESAAHADHGQELARETGQQAQVGMLLFARSTLDAHLGNQAADTAAGAAPADPQVGSGTAAELIMRAAAGLTELARGDAEAAHRQLAPAVDTVRRAGIAEPGAMRFVYDDIEALIRMGHIQDANQLLAWMDRCARETGRQSALATAARCHGLLLSATGDGTGALEALQHAVDRPGAVLPFERARSLLALGVAQRRARQKRAARSTLERAARGFGELGASMWVQQAEAELGRIGGRVATSGLTPTEQRVAELVAEGRTNREVAAMLFITPKTVETTLSHAYAKLGVGSRTALAHKMANIRETTGSGLHPRA